MRSPLISVVVFAAAALPALAQSDFPEPPMPQMNGPQMSRPPMGMMRPPERESLAEMQARSGRMFERLDVNHDGVVDAAELANARGGRMLSRFDADADGRITREEMNTGVEAVFKAMDRNGDGVVTADERPRRPN